MTYDFAPKLARVLTEYCRPIQRGDYVIIRGAAVAEPIIEALVEAVFRRGGHPSTIVGLTNLAEIAFRHAPEEHYDWIDPAARVAMEQADVSFYILADFNSKNLATVPPDRLARYQQGQRPLIELYLNRCENDDLRWNITAWPTLSGAQDAEMGLLEFTEFMYNACGLHHDDPVAYWTALRDQQDELIAWLEGKQQVEVHGPGIELMFSMAGRTWVNCYGVRNFPDGEIFTCPVEDSVNGTVVFNMPAHYANREVDGVKLVFQDGVVVEAEASKNHDFLLSQLDMDEGARRLGEFAVGTNDGIDRFTRNILFDEKMGGTIHMALGENANGAGGVNKSAIHWDMLHGMTDGGEIVVDGELFYKDGTFTV
ncbi:MAG: aminopeptidase [Chloroflexi bacterium]|nr:aminopeptidase [Chloroflexota bacterium]